MFKSDAFADMTLVVAILSLLLLLEMYDCFSLSVRSTYYTTCTRCYTNSRGRLLLGPSIVLPPVVSTERTSRVCGSHKVVRRFRFAAESGRNSTRSVLSKGQKEGLFPITRLSFFVNDHHFWASSVECIHREYSELCEVLGSCCVR